MPFHLSFEALTRFLPGKATSPEDTAATFVIPAWPGTPTWKLEMEKFQLVDNFPPYTDLFTATPLKAGEARRSLGPLKFPVAVITCPVGPIREDDASFRKFQELPDWKHEEQSMAVENLKLPDDMDADVTKRPKELFSRHEQPFANSSMDLGCCTIGTHKINTGEAPLVRQRAYSRPDNQFIGDSIEDLVKYGITEACESAWTSPVVMVEKKEGGARRLFVDQRRVNDVTVR